MLARQTPERAQRDLVLLDALGLPTRSSPATLARACTLAVDLEHHLFDTLYHATALEYHACLITADDRYHRKARTLAGISHLRDWNPTVSEFAAHPNPGAERH